MWILAGFMTLIVLGIIALGGYYELRPLPAGANAVGRFKRLAGLSLVCFVVVDLAILFLGGRDVMANPAVSEAKDVSIGMGLALIGIGLPTGLATIAAAMAVGPVGASSLAVIAEKPEMFGRTLIYLGLAEGIAIYGLVISILLLGQLG